MEEKNTTIFCKIVDVTLDGEGNIALFFSKEHDFARIKTIEILKTLKGRDVVLTVRKFFRREERT